MDEWRVVESVLVVALVIGLSQRARGDGRFQIVSMTLYALLAVAGLLQSVVERPRPWTPGVAALALTCCGIEIVRPLRHACGSRD